MNWNYYRIESYGIIGSIKNVTKDPYINGYLMVLNEALISENEELTRETAKRLCDWYTIMIDKLISDPFVYDKDSQLKTFHIIQNLYSDLMPNKASKK